MKKKFEPRMDTNVLIPSNSTEMEIHMPKIIVMLCYSRSGGTILNKCLGSLPDVVMMSEVNPLGGGWGRELGNSFTTIKSQAKNWYNIDLDSKEDDFAGCALELVGKCKHLILRDWSYINFLPHEYNKNKPPNKFLILEKLKGKCDIRPFAFVRDVIDIYLSKGGSLKEFTMTYPTYVAEILGNNIPICKYEDFCEYPEKIIRKLCGYMEIPFSDSFNNYRNFNTVNGDVQYISRGQKKGKITKLPRIKAPDHIMKKMFAQPLLKTVNMVFGYPTDDFEG